MGLYGDMRGNIHSSCLGVTENYKLLKNFELLEIRLQHKI